MTDGNTYAINKHLNDQEDYDALQEAATELEQAEARIEELEAKLAKADDTKTPLQKLSDIGQEMEKHREQYEADNDAWWNGLSEQEREDAFYAVCQRIYKAELQDKGTYRWALYDVFGFDGGMYSQGMNCGYMAIHNAIGDGQDYQAMRGVNRLEVIDDTGRALVKYLDKDERVRYSLQDDDRTLKVFIDKVHRVFTEDL